MMAASRDFAGNSTNSRITITDFRNPGDGNPGSMSIWVNLDNTGTGGGQDRRFYGQTGSKEWVMMDSAKVKIIISGSFPTGTSTLSANTWYHYMLRWDGAGSIDCHVNGSSEIAEANDPASVTGNHFWGGANAGEGMSGDSCHVAVYDRYISDAEMDCIRLFGANSIYKGRDVYLSGQDESTSTERDLSGNGNSGSVGSSVTTQTDGPPINIMQPTIM
jgi:hypothetical protein